VLTLAINNVAQKEEAAMKMLLVLDIRRPQSTACDVWSLRFQDKAQYSDNLPFSYVVLFLYTLICHYTHAT
jgi:hypothetical protein